MAGYTRQSAADIVAGQVIKAAPVHNEFQQVQTAFAALTGHKHDGSTGEGGYVPLIADVDALNKVVVDTANNRVSFYVDVGGVATEQLRIQDGAIVPVTDDDIDLGASGAEFKDLYIDGIGYIDSVVITGGTIDDTVIGGTTPAAGSFTTMDASGNSTVGGTLDVTGNTTVGGTLGVTGTSSFTGAVSAGSLTTTATATLADVDINGGAIDGTTIGATSTAAGSFTTVSTSGQADLASANIDGGTIDGTVIGGTSAQAITGTTITANTGFTGDLTGNVTGNVTGNITGDITGNVTGDLTGNVTAATGSSTFNDVTVNGTLDVTGTTIANVTDPTLAQDAATKNYVDTNDALKLNLTGGTMSGDITMGTNTVTGLGTPTNTTDATTKDYVDTNDALKLNLAGGTMSGNITMGGNTVTGLGTPTVSSDAATKGYVDTEVSALVDSAPGALDTLNELAAAINDDANFSTTITNSIATKLPLAGGTMSGDIAMGTNSITGMADPTLAQDAATKSYVDTVDATKLNLSGGTMTGDITLGANSATSTATPTTDDTLTRKGYVDTQDALKLDLAGGTMSGAIAMGTSKITGMGDPTANQDAATKAYVDTQDATKLSLSGGTMTGAIDMGANKVTTTYTPTDASDLTTKTYVDSILSSATDAATSAAAAATSATNAATSETNAATSAANAAASYDDFDDRYLGSKSSAPTVDNDGDALLTGALYWNSSSDQLFVWDGTSWDQAAFTLGDALTELSDDVTPQLGGDLDLNSQDITGTGNVDITGNVVLTGTVDGRDVAADGTKLDTIETNADVTDTANVTAAGALMKSGGTMTGDLILNADPTTALGAATKEYVDTIAAAGIHYHDPVRVEAPSNLNATYDNGTSGVGATLTNAGTQAALVIDGVTLSSADRVLIYNQTNAAHNGVYTVTDTGSVSTNWVLTRATDADSYGTSDPNAFGEGDAFFVKEGDTGAGELYVMNTSGTITFGTTNITFTVIAETAVYTAGTDITLDGTVFNLNSTIAADTTGNAATATALETGRNISLTGDVTGSASFDGTGDASITATVANDSHTHDGRYYTEAESDARFLGISAKAADSNLLDGIDSSAFLRSNANDAFTGAQLDINDTLAWTVSSSDNAHQRADARDDATNYSRLHWYGKSDTGATSNFRHAWYDGASYVNIDVSGGGVDFSGSATHMTIGGSTVWHSGNDGSGSGLDADTVDGLQASSFLRSDTSDTFTSISGTTVTANNMYVSDTIYHGGDTNTYLNFGIDTITLATGGSSEVTINTSGVRLGDTGNGYFQPVTGNYGSIQIDGGAHNGWEGYSIGGRAVFMHDNSSGMGLYDDVNNHWALNHTFNGTTQLYYDGSSKLQTTSGGAQINGDLTVTGGDIVLSGTGRIQGIDTVSSGTDAASKTYVDNAIAASPSGIPQNDGNNSLVIGSGAQYVTGTIPSYVERTVIIGDSAASGGTFSSLRNDVLIGYDANLDVTSGSPDSIIVIGAFATMENQSPDQAVVIGTSARGRYRSVTIGHNAAQQTRGGILGATNVCIGYYNSLNLNGSNNVMIGAEAHSAPSISSQTSSTAQCTGVGQGVFGTRFNNTNCTALGYKAKPSGSNVSNQFTLGDSFITALRCNVTSISSLSDARDKTNVQDIQWGLDFINDLRPVSFTWNSRDGEKVGGLEIGFIAQEVAQVEQDRASEPYTKMVDWDNPEALELAPHKAFPILVKAVQELSAQVEALETRLAALEGN